MNPFYFLIDGFDIAPWIAENGVKWQRADVDGPNAGRSLSGDAIRDRKAIKGRMDITIRPLYYREAMTLQNLILPEFVTVQWPDLLYGDVSLVFYSNNTNCTYGMAIGEDIDSMLINDITFPLVRK